MVGATVLGTALILAAHAVSPVATHVTRFEQEVDGPGGVVAKFVDRLQVGFDLIARNPLALIPVLGIVAALIIALRPVGPVRRTFERWPAWRDAIAGALLGGVVAYLVNDSGPAAAGFAFGLGLGGMLGVSLLAGAGQDGCAMSEPPVPPRPDAMHPVVRSTPPIATADGRPAATWSWWEALGIYVLSFLVGGLATMPVVRCSWARRTTSRRSWPPDRGRSRSWACCSRGCRTRTVGGGRSWVPGAGRLVGGDPGGSWGSASCCIRGWCSSSGSIVTLILGAVSGETVQAPEQVARGSVAGRPGRHWRSTPIVIAPIHEELFFRGMLFRTRPRPYGLVRGLVALGVAFALIHYFEGEWQDALLLMSVMFFNGIALAWWYERRGTIVAPHGRAVVFNVIGLSLIIAISLTEEEVRRGGVPERRVAADLPRSASTRRPTTARRRPTWEGDVAFVLEAEPDRGVPEDLWAFLDLWHGECRDARMVDPGEGAARVRDPRAVLPVEGGPAR